MTTPRKHIGRAKVIPKDTLLLPYQSKWVKDTARLKIAEKSRQIGWTWATAFGLVRRKGVQDARLDAWISSRDDIQARLFLEDCKNFANILHIGAKSLGEQLIDEDRHSAYVLQMANGLRLHSMSSNPDAQAGKRGDRVLDEFALHPDPRKLYSIAYPGITWGGSMEIFSTHRGTANFFNQLILEIKEKGNPKGFSLHRITLEDALNDGFLYKLQGALPLDDPRQEMDEAEYFNFIRSGCADEESFQEEYMCVPSDDATAFITFELLDGCKYQPGVVWEKDLADCRNLYVGVDVGRKHDLFVVWVAEEVSGHLFTRKVLTLQGKTYSEMEAELYWILDSYDVARCCVDATGLGNQFAERAAQRFGYRVEPIMFTAKSKEEMAYGLRSRMEDRTFHIPDDRQIFADFRAIRKETSTSGNIRFAGERNADGHSDRFWAAALCSLARGKRGNGTSDYEVAAPRGRVARGRHAMM